MTTTTTAKLNIELPEATEFSLCPLQFLGKRKKNKFNPFATSDGKPLARAKVKILSYIWTTQKNFGTHVELTKTDIARACGLSWSVVNESVKQLAAENLISVTNNVYKIIPKVDGSDYFLIENYLLKKKFNVNGKFKKLPSTAVLILNRIKAFYLMQDKDGNYINYDFKNRKPINLFYSSEQGLATLLNLSSSTVSDAVHPLLRLKLLYRNKQLRYVDDNGKPYYKIVQIKGVTGNTRSIFTVPYEILAVEQRSTYKPRKIDLIEDSDEIEITEEAIEKVYAELRSSAEDRYARARELASNDEEFIAAKAELENAMGATFAALENGDNVQESKKLWNAAQVRYFKRLAELGISEKELAGPQYLCRRCSDTGFTDTGQRCRCRANVKQLIISRIFKRK